MDGTVTDPLPISRYHRWRVCCGVPEGPHDLKVDEIMPLHVNMELLNFVSFSKGCYVGQELLTRTKHRGAVRRRVFIAIAADTGSPQIPQLRQTLKDLSPGSPTASSCIVPITESLQRDQGSDPVAVFARREGSDLKQVGVIQSVFQNVALCLLRCDGDFNDPQSFKNAPLPEGTEVVSSSGNSQILLRAPPYAFVSRDSSE